ncbi:RagB/SusD family nutrient uptake outer membrane protein [Sphingobacterium tabacisoli]|uniref:RagB/SusD family nutrient uptake outer membrane protein n=1 Tax=Sphingobacterium tabacisoli TaxID=2044855 RepID=A0ABW5L613_9SPHI|nr:RagB/SusD family nutrient uptake outer membrane protein [Sphingobacterium tabacisoli]
MKKINTYRRLIFLVFTPFVLFSCTKWIDVKPQTQVEEDVFFSKESGFKELLAGVYIKMGDPALYGREINFGLVDVLGQYYDLSLEPALDQTYQRAEKGNYTDVAVRTLVDNIWGNSYNAITNLNLLLQKLEEADKNIFQGDNYNIIKGEALGLRAFIHFDMLRLFAPSLGVGSEQNKTIPYVTIYKNQVTPRASYSDVISLILGDLEQAGALLKDDPLVTGRSVTVDDDNGYLTNRKLRFNYYAVQALEARVRLWNGDKAGALRAAERVIQVVDKFPWVQNSQLTGTANNIDRTFTTEYIFGLLQNKKLDNIEGYITDQAHNDRPLAITQGTLNAIYPPAESAADIRRSYLIRSVLNNIYLGKLYQTTQTNPSYANRMPLIRIPELYYIAAESLIGIDNAQAVAYLEKVRIARGVSRRLASTLTPEQIASEIAMEYRKEMASEGQLFFYNKRLNKTLVPGFTGSYDINHYTLPLPLNEVEYGR